MSPAIADLAVLPQRCGTVNCPRCGEVVSLVGQPVISALQDATWLGQVLNVKTKRAYDLISAGLVPGVVRLGRQVRVQEEAVLRWIQAGGTGHGQIGLASVSLNRPGRNPDLPRSAISPSEQG